MIDAVVCVASQHRRVVLSAPVRCNLYQLGPCSNGVLHMGFNFAVVASRPEALCGIWANCKSFLSAHRRRTYRVATP